MQCPSCGCKNIDYNEAGGDAVCMECSTVVEENAIVSSIEFSEVGGSSSVVGQYVSSTCSKPYAYGGGGSGRGRFGFSRDSRETTLASGRRKISQVANMLKLGNHYVESAFRLFTLAVEHNFVQGRKTMHIVAACIYIICRQEQTAVMLIDLSDVLRVNVFDLGKTFVKLHGLLNMAKALPIVDPALFIQRYAGRLELGEKTQAVCNLAIKITAQMNRDWINTGRRPAGICAVALQVACNTQGIVRSKEEIRKLLRISEATVTQRLREFEQTPAAMMTLSELNNSNPGQPLRGQDYSSTGSGGFECDPPCFIKNRIKDGSFAKLLAKSAPSASAGSTADASDASEEEMGVSEGEDEDQASSDLTSSDSDSTSSDDSVDEGGSARQAKAKRQQPARGCRSSRGKTKTKMKTKTVKKKDKGNSKSKSDSDKKVAGKSAGKGRKRKAPTMKPPKNTLTAEELKSAGPKQLARFVYEQRKYQNRRGHSAKAIGMLPVGTISCSLREKTNLLHNFCLPFVLLVLQPSLSLPFTLPFSISPLLYTLHPSFDIDIACLQLLLLHLLHLLLLLLLLLLLPVEEEKERVTMYEGIQDRLEMELEQSDTTGNAAKAKTGAGTSGTEAAESSGVAAGEGGATGVEEEQVAEAAALGESVSDVEGERSETASDKEGEADKGKGKAAVEDEAEEEGMEAGTGPARTDTATAANGDGDGDGSGGATRDGDIAEAGQGLEESSSEEERWSDIDEELELDGMIMSEEERKKKAAIWTALNKKFLEEQEAKEKDLERNKHKKKKTYKKHNRLKDTAVEGFVDMIQTKKMSRKIDYEALSGMFDSTGAIALTTKKLPSPKEATKQLSSSESSNEDEEDEGTVESDSDEEPPTPQRKRVKIVEAPTSSIDETSSSMPPPAPRGKGASKAKQLQPVVVGNISQSLSAGTSSLATRSGSLGPAGKSLGAGLFGSSSFSKPVATSGESAKEATAGQGKDDAQAAEDSEAPPPSTADEGEGSEISDEEEDHEYEAFEEDEGEEYA
ncbi:unnamed protein product [Chrysoparadoxa australica]